MRVSIEEVLRQIKATDMFDVRYETFCYDDAERVLRLVASSCPWQPDRPKHLIHTYGRFVFRKAVYTGEELATLVGELILQGECEPVVWKNYPHGSETEFDVTRVSSSQWYGFHQRKTPFLMFELPADVENDSLFNPYQPVNANGLPFFPTLQEAEAYFLLDVFLDNSNPSRRVMQIVIDDHRAFFEKILVTQNQLTITVAGDALADAQIKIHGKHPGLVDVIQVCGRTHFEVPLDTSSSELNVYLSVNDEILDHRLISERASIYAPTAGVTIKRDEHIGINGILDFRGENQYIEFKSGFSDGILKSICAFANAGGGSIFVGVTNEGELTGISDWDKERLRIEDTIYDRISGHVTVQYKTHPVPESEDTKVILEVIVFEATRKPIAMRERGKGETFYIRRDGTNRMMRRDDFIHVAQDRSE